MSLAERELDARVRARLGEAAAALGKPLITVETNLRELSDEYVPWVAYFGSALAAVARMHASLLSRVYLASALTYGYLFENGAHPLLDHLWNRPGLELVHDGAHLSRTQKVEAIAGDAVVRRTLRVCWQSDTGELNCGRCEKCLRTMATLEVLGVRAAFETFPDDLDLDAIAAIKPANRPEVAYWQELLELATSHGADSALMDAVESALERARPAPRRPVPRRPRDDRRLDAATRAVHRTLYLSPETGRELAARPAAVFLIGSYDGSGNYGDIAQLEAAVRLLADLGESIFALPLVDLRYLESHRRRSLAATANFDSERVLAFSLGGAGSAEAAANLGLVPASLPEGLSSTATYLYGGGYLNTRWAARILTMIEAVEALAARAGVPRHEMISSGLQIEPRWARGLPPGPRRMLAGLRQVGVRDQRSAAAAVHLADGDRTPVVLRSGDDAVGVLDSLLDAPSPRSAFARAGAQPPPLPRRLGDRRTRASVRLGANLPARARRALRAAPSPAARARL